MPRRAEKFSGFRSFLEAKKRELEKNFERSLAMTFSEVAELGCPLPRSAYMHRAWWANNGSKVWVRAGFRIESVDMEKNLVRVRRQGPVSPEERKKDAERAIQWRAELRKKLPKGTEIANATTGHHDSRAHPLVGALTGTIRLVAGPGRTAPADPDWGRTAGSGSP